MEAITLKKVKMEQLTFNQGEVYFHRLNNNTRWKNSRGGKTVKLTDDGLNLRRWCEQCGAPFSTVNAARRLCDECHDEICEALGVDYTNYPMPRKPTTKLAAQRTK